MRVSKKGIIRLGEPDSGKACAWKVSPNYRPLPPKWPFFLFVVAHAQRRDEGFLRDLDAAILAHPLLAFLLLFQKLLLAADVAARSEEHTSELQSLMRISYAVFCLKKIITI